MLLKIRSQVILYILVFYIIRDVYLISDVQGHSAAQFGQFCMYKIIITTIFTVTLTSYDTYKL